MSNTYPLLFALGTFAGLLWLLLADPDRRLSGRWRDLDAAAFLRVDAGLAALASGLIGARASYVGAHWDYYASHTAEAFSFSAGGLSWVGGALGAALGLFVLAALRRAPVWPLVDSLALPGAFLAAASWAGCLVDGCGYGRPLASGSASLFSADIFDSRLPRWPTQLIGLLSCFAIVLGVMALEPRSLRPGLVACLTFAALGLIGLVLSLVRGDPVPLLAGVRLDFVGAAIVTALGIAGLLSRRAPGPA